MIIVYMHLITMVFAEICCLFAEKEKRRFFDSCLRSIKSKNLKKKSKFWIKDTRCKMAANRSQEIASIFWLIICFEICFKSCVTSCLI